MDEQKIKKLILDALKNVKASDPANAGLEINDRTVVLGMGSALDSIAFTGFATELEEIIEDQTGEEYVLDVEEILNLHKGKRGLQVDEMTKIIARLLNAKRKNVKK